MKLIDVSVSRPIGVVICVLIALVIGVVSLSGLAIDLLPNIEIPVAVVVTSYPGAAPEEVVNLVSKPLEGALSTLEGLETIQSNSSTGQSVIIMMFKYGLNLDSTLLDVRDKVEQGKMMLPDGADNPMVIKIDPNAQPIIQLSLSGDIGLDRLTQIAEDVVQPQLERIPGVAQASITGDRNREIQITADPAKLHGYGLTINDIVQGVSANNSSMTAGNIIRGSQDINVRLIGEYKNIRDIENILLRTSSGQQVKMSEIASVVDSFKDQSTYAFVNGEPSLSLSVSKQSDANTVRVAQDVMKQIETLSANLPAGATLTVIMNTADFIQSAISNVIRSLLLGSLFATIVLFLFLRNIRSTLVIAIAIPISLMATLMMMYFSGLTINILTMSGLALGVGMMLDSSIVILENIYRYRQDGFGKIEAAIKGAKEVVAPVIAAALTTVAAFVPIIFTSGLVAELFRPLALTISFALLASLLISITLVPMLSSRMVRGKDLGKKQYAMNQADQDNQTDKKHNFIDRFGIAVSEFYPRILRWAIHHKKTTVVISTVMIIGSIALIPFIRMEFIPNMDQGEINISMTLPNGTSMDETQTIMNEFEEYIISFPDVELVSATIGVGSMFDGTTSTNKGILYIRLVPERNRVSTTSETMLQINQYGKQFPDLTINTESVQSGGVAGSPISVKITGNDTEILKALAEEVEANVINIAGTTNVSNSLSETRPELHVLINAEIASEYGLASSQVMQMVRTGFNGQVASRMKTEGQEIDLFVALPDKYREDINQLKSMKIMAPNGISVTLESLADFVMVDGPNTIIRENMEQAVTVTADLLGADLQTVTAELSQVLAGLHPPEGYMITAGGQNEDLEKAIVDLGIALLLAIFLVYAVMAIQFESLMYPFIVMFSLPAIIIGIIVGLFITGQTLSVFGLIGVVMLAGIVVNNAIVFVDYINTLRGNGMERSEAILLAGRHRLRPILMTTLTTILAMLPISLGMGEGTEMQQSLGTVIVFGLAFSTLVTLVLVPVMYINLDSFSVWTKKLFNRTSDKNIGADHSL